MRPVFAHLAALAVACASSAARADSAVVMIDSEADIMVESLVRVAAEDALRTAALEAAPLEAAGTLTLDVLTGCVALAPSTPQPCFTESYGASADKVLLLRVSGGDGDAPTVIESFLFDAHDGTQLGSEDRECSGCSDPDRLAQTVEELVADILVAGHLEVEEEVAPPVAVPVAPAVTRDSGDGRPYLLWKYVALGTGVASVALGATLIAVDGPRVEDGVRQPEERASSAEGFAAVGVGAALLATGAVLWVLDQRDAQAQRNAYVTPLVGPSSTGAAIGGRF